MRLPLLKERLLLSPKLYYSRSKGPGFCNENNEEKSSNNLRDSNVWPDGLHCHFHIFPKIFEQVIHGRRELEGRLLLFLGTRSGNSHQWCYEIFCIVVAGKGFNCL